MYVFLIHEAREEIKFQAASHVAFFFYLNVNSHHNQLMKLVILTVCMYENLRMLGTLYKDVKMNEEVLY